MSVENALYSDSRVNFNLCSRTALTLVWKVMEAAAVAVPDERLGELQPSSLRFGLVMCIYLKESW